MGGAMTAACLFALFLFATQQSPVKKAPEVPAASSPAVRSFDTPQQAADVLIEAAEKFDVASLVRIFGPDGNDIEIAFPLAGTKEADQEPAVFLNIS